MTKKENLKEREGMLRTEISYRGKEKRRELTEVSQNQRKQEEVCACECVCVVCTYVWCVHDGCVQCVCVWCVCGGYMCVCGGKTNLCNLNQFTVSRKQGLISF